MKEGTALNSVISTLNAVTRTQGNTK